MTELDSTIVSKSQEKREAEAVSQLAEQLCQLKRKQLDRLPYPNLVDAIMTYQKNHQGERQEATTGFHQSTIEALGSRCHQNADSKIRQFNPSASAAHQPT